MQRPSLFTITLPVLLGYIPLGITFGFLMVSQGIAWYIPILFSIFVFAGAAQFLAVGLVVNHASLLDTAIATFLINLRHVFYGLSLFDALPVRRWERWYSIFALTDETFSVLTTLPKALQTALMSRIALLNQLYWLAGTLAGALIGGGLTEWIPHLDFALASLFVILAYEQYRANRAWWPCALAVLAFIAAGSIAPQYLLFAAVLLCAAVIVLRSLLWKPGAAS